MAEQQDNDQQNQENTLSLSDEKGNNKTTDNQNERRGSHADEDVYNYEYDEYSEDSQVQSHRRARDRPSRQMARRASASIQEHSSMNASFTNALNMSQMSSRRAVGNMESQLERQRDETSMRSRRGLTRRGTQNLSEIMGEPPAETMPVRQATRSLAETMGGDDKIKDVLVEKVKEAQEAEKAVAETPAEAPGTIERAKEPEGGVLDMALQESNMFVKPDLSRQLSAQGSDLALNENKSAGDGKASAPTSARGAKSTDTAPEAQDSISKTNTQEKKLKSNNNSSTSLGSARRKAPSSQAPSSSHNEVILGEPKQADGISSGSGSFQPPPITPQKAARQGIEQNRSFQNPPRAKSPDGKSLNITLSQSIIGDAAGVQPEQVISLAEGAEGPFYKASKGSDDYTVEQSVTMKDLRRFLERFQRHFQIHVTDLAGFNFNTIIPADISAAQDMFLQSQQDYEILHNKHTIATKALDVVKQFFEYRGLQFDETDPKAGFAHLREQLLSETVAAERYTSGEDLMNTVDIEQFSKLHIIEEYKRVRRLFRVTVRQLQSDLEAAKLTIQQLRLANNQLKGRVADQEKKVSGLKQRTKVMSRTQPYSMSNSSTDPYGFDDLRKQSQALLKRAEQLGYK